VAGLLWVGSRRVEEAVRGNYLWCTQKWMVGLMPAELQEGFRGHREEAVEEKVVELVEFSVVCFRSWGGLGLTRLLRHHHHCLLRVRVLNPGLLVVAIVNQIRCSVGTCEDVAGLGFWMIRMGMRGGEFWAIQ
jgi:hypothetical protein